MYKKGNNRGPKTSCLLPFWLLATKGPVLDEWGSCTSTRGRPAELVLAY